MIDEDLSHHICCKSDQMCAIMRQVEALLEENDRLCGFLSGAPWKYLFCLSCMAEREGFEPPVAFRLRLISSQNFVLLHGVAPHRILLSICTLINAVQKLPRPHAIAHECTNIRSEQPPEQPPD